MNFVEIIEKAGGIAGAIAAIVGALTAIGGVVTAVVTLANKRQDARIKRTFNEAISSPAYNEMLEGKVDSRITAAFASSKDIENNWRRDFEVKQAEVRGEIRSINERIGQVDKRAETAHARIDEFLERK